MTNKNKRVTINDIAKVAKVSKSTVSLVLQKSPLVKPETREKVEKAMAKTGYVYNRHAANLRSNSSNVIGLLIHDLTNPFFAELYVGIEQALAEAGYITVLSNTSENPKTQTRNFSAISEHNIAGFIICPAMGTEEGFVHALEDQKFPVVLVMRPLPGDHKFDLVTADNKLGTFLATQHLIEQGFERIAFLGGQSSPVFKERMSGYKKALTAADIPFDKNLVHECLPNRPSGNSGIRTLVEQHGKNIDACVCYNDQVAMGTLWGLSDMGIAAGKDFGVMGFDNVAGSAYTNPPLSTISTDPHDIGVIAANAILRKMEKPRSKAQVIRKKPELVVRFSSKQR